MYFWVRSFWREMYLHKTYILPKIVGLVFWWKKSGKSCKRDIPSFRHTILFFFFFFILCTGIDREKIQYCLVSTTLYFSPQIRKMYYWLKIYFSGKLWATLDQCFHHAMVPNFVFNMSTKRISSESMGPYTVGGQWSFATYCFSHMEGSRRVSAYETRLNTHIESKTTSRTCLVQKCMNFFWRTTFLL